MPVPKPKPGESKDTFIARCIRLLSDEDPNRDRKQVIAICFQQWRDRRKESSESTMPEETQYKKDEDGNFIIAENVPIVFNSTMSPISDEQDEEEKKDGGE